MMDKIEAQIELPEGSLPLDHYSRYYAGAGNGQVEALYSIHASAFLDDVRK